MADGWDWATTISSVISTLTSDVTTSSDVITTTTHDVLTTTTHDVITTSDVISTSTPEVSNVTFLPFTTVAPDNSTVPEYLGFICAAVSVITYGSNFVPVKKYETGDGMFFQWMLSMGILFSSIILQMVRPAKFYPIVMLGGFLWSTGNVCVVPVIKTIGMGLGLCIWGMFNLLAGWASGRFGLFGINAEVPGHVTLNYVGVALAVLSSGVYMLVKTELHAPDLELTVDTDSEKAALLVQKPINQYEATERRKSLSASPGPSEEQPHLIFKQSQPPVGFSLESLSPKKKKLVGVSLSVFSGLLYGVQFTPAIYVQDHPEHYDNASQNSLDYVFAQFCGIFLTSSVYFFIYVAVCKNKPRVYPQVILPAVVSGAMWGVATGCWFIANKSLSEPVAFPIISTGPGVIASLFWGVIIFKEVKGKRNIAVLLLAFAITTTGAVLAGVSKA